MRTILTAGALAVALAAASAAGSASTQSAWSALARTAHSECGKQIKILAANARVSRITGRVSGIGGDGDLYYALTFKGKMGGAEARWLCLYDKHSKKAQAREITD
ncbi:MAG: hypothetical protein JSR55_14040 [Proteobacteria bacterium]|nr:hypothetical protein [Pseudomonadota bacterium]